MKSPTVLSFFQLSLLVLAALPFLVPSFAAAAGFQKIVFGCPSDSLAGFETFARRAQQSGATHIVLTAEDLPWARWQYDTPGDPYPAWAISNHGLLKFSVPDALRPYVPREYSDAIMNALRDRCRILGRLGLKGMVTSFEPQMLPEKVYEDHPLWRGPQVDSPPRSRVPRFAPDIDNPEVLALYRESVRKLVTTCPQIDTFSFYTNDSGSGMSWAEGLYPGANGSMLGEGRRMHQRYRDFFAALRAGVADAGVANLEIDVKWDREKNRELIALKLEAGTAISNLEGPRGSPYKGEVGYLLDYLYPFYPVVGIPVAVNFLEELEAAHRGGAPRLFVLIGDPVNQELYFSIYDAFRKQPTQGHRAREELLMTVAAKRVGDENAEDLLAAWLALALVEDDVELLQSGGTIFYLGSVQQRWLTRPFVPFPEELEPEEKEYYRRFQFQASTEERANNLHDLQATRNYSGYGGRFLAGKILGRIISRAEDARRRVGRLAGTRKGADSGVDPLLASRVQAFVRLAHNCRNAVTYQHYLDVCKTWDLRRPYDLAQGKSIPEWMALRQSARQEMDNTALLLRLLESTEGELLDLARTPGETDIRILDSDLAASLRTKLKIMSAHWEDHERLFMVPRIEP
jgi:hypothetical protein